MWEYEVKPSLTHDVEITMKYTDGIFSTTYTFDLNHVDYYGNLDEHINFHMVQPTLYGTPKEIMIRDVEKLKKDYYIRNLAK